MSEPIEVLTTREELLRWLDAHHGHAGKVVGMRRDGKQIEHYMCETCDVEMFAEISR